MHYFPVYAILPCKLEACPTSDDDGDTLFMINSFEEDLLLMLDFNADDVLQLNIACAMLLLSGFVDPFRW